MTLNFWCQTLQTVFAIDRTRPVGADGATHAGDYEIAFLSNLPGFTVMVAAGEAELLHIVATAIAHPQHLANTGALDRGLVGRHPSEYQGILAGA